MLAPHDSPAPATAAVSRTSQKMLQLLRKRLRQLLRVTLVLAICLAVAASALAIWWLTSLNGLPDIGDPFDVAELRSFSIPDDENAFTFFRRAKETLTPLPQVPSAQHDRSSVVPWSMTHPKLRAWVEANRPAVELFLQGAERADGISRPAGEGYSEATIRATEPGWLIWLVLSEGGRREESGDMAGAWDCYRAILRMTVHVRRRESLFYRAVANSHHDSLRKRLTTWASDPRTTIPQLRRALDEAVESRPRPEWDTFSLKIEYLDLMHFLERPDDRTFEQLEDDLTYRLGDMQLPTDLVSYAYGVRRSLLREPERSRRAIRLLFANWLANAEFPDLRQRKPAVRASFHVPKRTITVSLYPASREAPAGAACCHRGRWQDGWSRPTTPGFPSGKGSGPPFASRNRGIIGSSSFSWPGSSITASAGALPPSEDALVGTYLKSLPDDGSADLDDGTMPTVQ